jgi:putative peptide maturation system protein
MNDSWQQLLADTLPCLISFVREGTQPGEAKAQLRLLQQQHLETKMELVWEQEAYDQSLHYDALLYRAGEGCVSLSFCPDQTLPWPMRGVHRWREEDLVRVNHKILKVGEAVANLDFIWDDERLVNHLIDTCIISETIEAEPVDISDAELQHAMNDFRQAHKLYTAADTYQWMQQHSMTHQKFEQLIQDKATIAKLRDRITADRVEVYFNEHRTDFDTVSMARFEIANEPDAIRACEQIRQGLVDFFEAAQQAFLASPPPQSASNVFSVVERRHLPRPLDAALVDAAPAELIGPIPTGERYAILRVLSVAPAQLDAPTRDAIAQLLFDEWLEQQRRQATIEWNWG